jgi:transposase-like protein
MKNLISPETLAFFQQEPTPLKEIVDFLDSNSTITTASLCKATGIPPRKIHDFKYLNKKNTISKKNKTDVVPKSATKKQSRYSAVEKFSLIEKYITSSDEEKTKLLRSYGIYQSDIQNWRALAKEASLLALGKRKTRTDKKPEEQLKIEMLEGELRDQEKTTAKLSALLVLQKKTFDMLRRND